MFMNAPSGDDGLFAVPAAEDAAVVRQGPRLRQADRASRPALERFIAARFAEVYGAQIHAYLPQIYGMHGADDSLLAAFGLRSAAGGRLFLEHYLDRPVQEVVAAQTGECTRREAIAEVGNLAGAAPGALRQLIPLLTRLLHGQGYRWVVFTGAARLCNGFSRLGLPLSVMAPAPVARLPAGEREHWGSYYRHAPTVMLGDVLNGHRQLQDMARWPAALDAVLAPVAKVGAP